jgi:molybdopterin converting factor small subunit
MSVASDTAVISVHLSGALCDYCGSTRDLAIEASNARSVGDALRELERSHPSVYRAVCDETGAVRQHIGVFVNDTHIRDRDGLDTALTTGDTLTILPAVSGG